MKIETKALKKLIQAVQPAVSSSSTLDTLRLIHIEPTGSGLRATATDVVLVYQYEVEVEGSDTLVPFVVDGKRLVAILRAIEDDEVEVSVSPTQLRIVDGIDTLTLELISATQYPLPTVPLVYPSRVNGKAFSEALNRAVIAASDDPNSAMLHSVNVMVNEGDGLMVANNSHFAAQIGFESGTLPEMDICLSRDCIERFVKQLAKAREDVEVALTEGFMCFRLGPLQIMTRLVELDYPDCSGMILEEYGQVLTYEHRRMTASLAKLAAIAGDKIHTAKMVFGKRPGTMSLKSTTHGLGKYVGKVAYEGDAAPETAVTVNAWYLSLALANLIDEKLTISSTLSDAPMLVKGEGDQPVTYIILPLRS